MKAKRPGPDRIDAKDPLNSVRPRLFGCANSASHADEGLHLMLMILLVGAFIWSSWDMAEQRNVWGLHVAPVGMAALAIIGLYPFFHFSRRSYLWSWGFLVFLLVGAHYGDTHVPLFVWAEATGWVPEHSFDRLAHVLQGVVPAMMLNEVLAAGGIVSSARWRVFIVIACSLALSASYEIVEWIIASMAETRPTDFVTEAGGQTWDTQWDMALALAGAAASPFITVARTAPADKSGDGPN